jgi:hypothetical protein
VSALLYTPWLVTLSAVKQHRRLPSGVTTDDALIMSLIAENSAAFAEALGRSCVPFVDTRSFTVEYRANLFDLRIDEDLLAVTSIVDANGTAIAPSEYTLEPLNTLPARMIRLKESSGRLWDFGGRDDVVTVTGVWGYAPHYQRAWSLVTTASVIADAVTTSVTVANAAQIEVGDHILIDSEQLFVSAVSGVVLTVVRGANGTTAASHAGGAGVRRWQALWDIAQTVREMVVYAYLNKDAIGRRVTVYGVGAPGATAEVSDIGSIVEATLKRHRRKWAMISI